MIKKIFITLLSIIGFGISFTNAYSCNYVVQNYNCLDYLNFGQYDSRNLFFGGSVDNNNFSFYNGNDYKFSFNIPLNGESFNVLNYWWQGGGLRYSSRFSEGDSEVNGNIDGFYVCDNRPGNSYYHLSDKNGCVYHDGFDNFGQYISNSSTYVFACNRGYPNVLNSKDVNCVVCVCNGNCGYNKQHICIDKSKTSNNSNIFITGDYNSGGNLISGIELNSTGSAINYFEDYYGWDEKICYVGVDNVTDLWGSSVEYKPGSGLDIFDTFELLYGNIELTRMYVWMNAWLINYNQWFQDNVEDRLYLANYNSGTNQVDLYYDNLTSPFENQPVALYFMSYNVSNYTDRQTMGSDVVSYCYLKLKGGTYDNIIDNSTKQSIDQYTKKSNINKGLNPDGTIKNIDYSGFGHYGSGELTGDNSLKGILQRLFGDVDMLKSVPINSNYKILPDWLIISFIFVVLFKILRKK